FEKCRSGQQPGPDAAYQLVNRRIALNAEELGHIQRAHLGTTGYVVAQQVHDHPVLGLILGIVAQRFLKGCVFLGRLPARHCSLHGQRLDPAVSGNLEEKLRRARQNDGTGKIDKGRIAHRLTLHQPFEEPERIALPARRNGEGEIALIAIAHADVVMQAGKALFILGQAPGGRGIKQQRLGRLRRRLRRQFRRAVENTKAKKRRAAIFRQVRDKGGIEQIARLVGDVARQPLSAAPELFRLPQRRNELFGLLCKENVLRRREGDCFMRKVVAEERNKVVTGSARGLQPLFAQGGRRPASFAGPNLRRIVRHELTRYCTSSRASISYISPSISESPLLQKAGSEASSPKGARSSE